MSYSRMVYFEDFFFTKPFSGGVKKEDIYEMYLENVKLHGLTLD